MATHLIAATQPSLSALHTATTSFPPPQSADGGCQAGIRSLVGDNYCKWRAQRDIVRFFR